jgi:DNA-binding beta-propeller fold protein YncE
MFCNLQGGQAFVAHDARLCLSNNSVAVGVLGQVSLNLDIGGCSRVQIGVAADIAVNPVTGDVYIADSINNRILVYLSVTIKAAIDLGITSFVNIPADFVLGQPDFTSNGASNTQQGIVNPVALHIDANQNLWVACKLANRVLKFNLLNIFVGLNIGVGVMLDAQLVLGQNDFVSVGVAVHLGLGVSLNAPVDVFLDEADDRLWVVDQGNKRAVFYNTASSLTIGATISGFIGVNAHASANVLGILSLDISLDARVLVMPTSIVVDALGNVYIADAVLNRVLRFNKAAYLAAAAHLDVNLLGLAQVDVCVVADLVIGQPNFSSTSSSPTTMGSLNQPMGLAIIPGLLNTVGTLVAGVVQTVDGVVGTILNDVICILDNLTHRITILNLLPSVLPPGLLSSGPASALLGQPSASSSYLYGNPKGTVTPAGFGVNLNAAVFSPFYNWLFVCTGARVLVYICL